MAQRKRTETPAEAQVEQQKLEKEYLIDTGTVLRTHGAHVIHCMTVIGSVEGHVEAPQGQKTTKYEHVIPQLVDIEEDPLVEGLLVILNTVGGDVEAGLALAELISGVTKPTATMTIHPVRHSGLVLGVPQTMRYFEQMQDRITGFVVRHSNISEERFTQLMMRTGELVMDVGTVLDGQQAVEEGLIDQLGSVGEALHYLYQRIDGELPGPTEQAAPRRRRKK